MPRRYWFADTADAHAARPSASAATHSRLNESPFEIASKGINARAELGGGTQH
jgi:hypothetical protein